MEQPLRGCAGGGVQHDQAHMMAPRLLGLILLLLLPMSLGAAEGFNVRDIAGKTHTLGEYKGQWVLVNFWAIWCPPCLEEIPELISLHDAREKLAVIGVVVDYKSVHEVHSFVDDNLMSYPVVLGSDKVVQQFGSADMLPTTYIYNPRGQLVKIHRGQITRQQVEKLLKDG